MICCWKPAYCWFQIKLIVMAYKDSVANREISAELREIKRILEK